MSGVYCLVFGVGMSHKVCVNVGAVELAGSGEQIAANIVLAFSWPEELHDGDSLHDLRGDDVLGFALELQEQVLRLLTIHHQKQPTLSQKPLCTQLRVSRSHTLSNADNLTLAPLDALFCQTRRRMSTRQALVDVLGVDSLQQQKKTLVASWQQLLEYDGVGVLVVDFYPEAQVVAAKLLESNSSSLENVASHLASNPIINLVALENRMLPSLLSKELTSSKDFMLKAAKINGLVLQVTCDDFKQDMNLVLAAVRENSSALFEAPGFFDNRDVVLAAANSMKQTFWTSVLEQAVKFQDDEEVVLADVRLRGMDLQFASERLQDSWKVVHQAMLHNLQAFSYASPRLQRKDLFTVLHFQLASACCLMQESKLDKIHVVRLQSNMTRVLTNALNHYKANAAKEKQAAARGISVPASCSTSIRSDQLEALVEHTFTTLKQLRYQNCDPGFCSKITWHKFYDALQKLQRLPAQLAVDFKKTKNTL